MLTGQYGHNNGVLDNKYRLLHKKRNVLPVWLERSGYTTIHVGRYLNGYERVAKARTRPAPGWSAVAFADQAAPLLRLHALGERRHPALPQLARELPDVGPHRALRADDQPLRAAVEAVLPPARPPRPAHLGRRGERRQVRRRRDPRTAGRGSVRRRAAAAAAQFQRGGQLRQALVHPFARRRSGTSRSPPCASATAARSARCARSTARSPRSTTRSRPSARRTAPSSSSSPTTATTTASTGSRSPRTTATPRATGSRC